MASASELLAPEHLTAAHDVSAFDSGVPELDDWFRKRALANEDTGASRTYVVCAGGRVVGYYALATGSVAHEQALGRVRRNMPDPVPVMILGRLAVDRAWQGRSLGSSLLRDAVLRTLQAAKIGGIRAILVHAISEEARRFYQRHGFGTSPVDPLTLMITVAEAEKALGMMGDPAVSAVARDIPLDDAVGNPPSVPGDPCQGGGRGRRPGR
jgi:GNAT superfamily N-acetyltransferase